MGKKNIRSEYIKNLMAEQENIGKVFEENTKKAIKDILAESLPDGIKRIIAEADEKAEGTEPEVEEVEQTPEEEVVNDDTDKAKEEPEEEGEEKSEETEIQEPEVEVSEETEAEETENEEVPEDEETLASIEDLKDENGEYDLTGMNDEDFIKVMKVVKPEDGVRVVKDCENNTLTITDDENETEYVIELDDICEDGCETEEDEIKECVLKKPVGIGFGSKRELEKPFSKRASIKEDENVFEIELDDEDDDEEPIEIENVEVPENETEGKHYGKAWPQRKSANHRNGYDNRGFSEEMKEGVERKINEIMEENRQLKEIASKIKEQLTEEAVINGSLANIVKLVVENTTSRDEKIEIIKRFDSVRTLQEGKALYESISKELNKNAAGTKKVKINENLTEAVGGKNANMVKTALYESADLSRTKDLMKRMGL